MAAHRNVIQRGGSTATPVHSYIPILTILYSTIYFITTHTSYLNIIYYILTFTPLSLFIPYIFFIPFFFLIFLYTLIFILIVICNHHLPITTGQPTKINLTIQYISISIHIYLYNILVITCHPSRQPNTQNEAPVLLRRSLHSHPYYPHQLSARSLSDRLFLFVALSSSGRGIYHVYQRDQRRGFPRPPAPGGTRCGRGRESPPGPVLVLAAAAGLAFCPCTVLISASSRRTLSGPYLRSYILPGPALTG